MPRPPKTESDYNAIAAARGYEWLGQCPKYVKDKTLWRCNNGHEWQVDYDSLRSGKGCPTCGFESGASKRRHSEDDYRAIAQKQGTEWVGPLPSTRKHKTCWRCPNGHTYWTTYNCLAKEKGNGCFTCAHSAVGEAKRKSPAQYRSLAVKLGIEWVGELPNSVVDPTAWVCRICGQRWDGAYVVVKRGKGRCPSCSYEETAASQRNTETEYRTLAAQHKLEWAGDVLPLKVETKTLWRCQAGHVFERDYNSLQTCPYCPDCKGIVNGHYVSNPQRYIHKHVGGLLNYRHGARSSIDIAIVDGETKIGIEYDGWHWHRHKEDEDKRKRMALVDQGWAFLVIKGHSLVPDIQSITAALTQLKSGAGYIEIVMRDWGT